jgi:DNA-binding NtrC family response regulator
VGELSPSAQAKLLRVLDDRRVRKLGQEQDALVDCRVIAATHRSLANEVKSGRFREDLHMRLAGLSVHVPPLRDRASDVPLLFVSFLRRALEALGRPAPGWLFRPADLRAPPVPLSFFESLIRYAWPGNVRELERLATATGALCAARGTFEAPRPGADTTATATVTEPSRPSQRLRPAREDLVRLLEQHGQIQRRVAQALGVPYATLDRWLREHGIARARDLDAAEVRAALDRTGGDVARAAEALGVSPSGLRRRVADLER